MGKREGVAGFAAMNVGEARAKEIPSDNEVEIAVCKNGGLRIDAVGQAGLIVARIGGADDVNHTG